MQNNDFRSATNLRALGQPRSNNTFATATNLGTVSPNATRVTFRASGTVGRFDNVDFYKFTVPPGVSLPSGSNRFQLRGGSTTFSAYGEAQGQRALGARFKLQQGSTTRISSLVNPVQFPVTIYFKLESRVGETQYNCTFNYFR